MVFPLILIGKLIFLTSRLFNLGSGGTWPGEIALLLFPDIFPYFARKVKRGLIIIAGTNGKTTTAKMIKHILIKTGVDKKRIIHNDSGANLLNGLVSSFIQSSSLTGKLNADYAVFEVDEANVPLIISRIKNQELRIPSVSLRASKKQKLVLVFLNLFRDQLDRYGEVDTLAKKWEEALKDLSKETTIILNADDPQIAYLGKSLKNKVEYFGIDRPNKFLPSFEHSMDSSYCRSCGDKLNYKGIYFSHLGIWFCPHCSNKRPKSNIGKCISPLPGLYNEYNTLASVSVAKALGISEIAVESALKSFIPAFGRQEEFVVKGKRIKIFLSKNPAGFNASLRTVLEQNAKAILLLLNDRIPDGKDVSWIWDVDFEMIPSDVSTFVSGERAYDLGLRIKYTIKQWNNKTMEQLTIEPDLKKAINIGLESIDEKEVLYILSTYSAMLQVRKILTGRKIL